MIYKIGLGQCASVTDKAENLKKAERIAGAARAGGVSLLVFPENFMMPYEAEREVFLRAAEDLDGPFVRGMGEIARKHQLWIVFCMVEKAPGEKVPCDKTSCDKAPNNKTSGDTERTYNTAVLLDDRGQVRTSYHKVHTYDAFGEKESDRIIPGDQMPEVVETPFGRIAMAICYDLRFPELARLSALAACDLLIYPAAWVRGDHKSLHWQTLMTARAIENGIFIAGCSYVNHKYLGESRIVDPYGETIAAGGGQEELVVGEVDPDMVREAQARSLTLANRRDDLYG